MIVAIPTLFIFTEMKAYDNQRNGGGRGGGNRSVHMASQPRSPQRIQSFHANTSHQSSHIHATARHATNSVSHHVTAASHHANTVLHTNANTALHTNNIAHVHNASVSAISHSHLLMNSHPGIPSSHNANFAAAHNANFAAAHNVNNQQWNNNRWGNNNWHNGWNNWNNGWGYNNNWWGSGWNNNWFYSAFLGTALGLYLFDPYWYNYQPDYFYPGYDIYPQAVYNYNSGNNPVVTSAAPQVTNNNSALPDNETWVSPQDNNIPENAVVNTDANGQSTYYCRAKYMNKHTLWGVGAK